MSCKTIIICNDVYIICKINKCCGYERKKNKFQVWFFFLVPSFIKTPETLVRVKGTISSWFVVSPRIGWYKAKPNVLIFNEVNNLMVPFYRVYVFRHGFAFFFYFINSSWINGFGQSIRNKFNNLNTCYWCFNVLHIKLV